jgi:hypothetical protein
MIILDLLSKACIKQRSHIRYNLSGHFVFYFTKIRILRSNRRNIVRTILLEAGLFCSKHSKSRAHCVESRIVDRDCLLTTQIALQRIPRASFGFERPHYSD